MKDHVQGHGSIYWNPTSVIRLIDMSISAPLLDPKVLKQQQ